MSDVVPYGGNLPERAPVGRSPGLLPSIDDDADVFIVVHDAKRDIWAVGRLEAAGTEFAHVPDPSQRQGPGILPRFIGTKLTAMIHREQHGSSLFWMDKATEVMEFMRGPRNRPRP